MAFLWERSEVRVTSTSTAIIPCWCDDGQHAAGRDDHEADVDVPAVLLEPRAVVVADWRERLPHEGAVLQLHHERAELVQPLADARRRRHGRLAVRRTPSDPRWPRGLVLKALPLPRRAAEVDLARCAPVGGSCPGWTGCRARAWAAPTGWSRARARNRVIHAAQRRRRKIVQWPDRVVNCSYWGWGRIARDRSEPGSGIEQEKINNSTSMDEEAGVSSLARRLKCTQPTHAPRPTHAHEDPGQFSFFTCYSQF